MIPYRDHNGGGAILGFSQGPRHIEVRFQGGNRYRYSYDSAGSGQVEAMKRLARTGSGLHGYIRENQPRHEEARQ